METAYYIVFIILGAITLAFAWVWCVMGIRAELKKKKYYDLLVRNGLKESRLNKEER